VANSLLAVRFEGRGKGRRAKPADQHFGWSLRDCRSACNAVIPAPVSQQHPGIERGPAPAKMA
jgi:hypothetical protein